MGVYENAKMETRRKIVHAFWDLYKTTSIEKIAVKDITDASGIYRTTFYLHFSDIYAILEQIEKHYLDELTEIGNRISKTEAHAGEHMEVLHEMLRKNCDYLQVLVNERKNPKFAEKYKKEMVKCVCAIYQIDLAQAEERSKILIQKTLSVMIDLFFEWVDTKQFSFDEMAGNIDGYMKNGILDTFQKETEKLDNEK